MILDKFRGNKKFYLHVLSLALPLMFQQLTSASISLINNIMVGSVVVESGEKGLALAGVIAVNRLHLIALYGLMGVMNAATIFIAQYYGAKDENHIKQAHRFGVVASIVLGIFFCTAASIFPESLVRFFTSDAIIVEQGVRYLRFLAFSLIPLSLSIAIGDSMRAVGEIRTPMFCTIVGMITNCFFNYLFIFGNLGFPQLGVAGAGLSTLLSRLIELGLLSANLFLKDFPFKTRLRDLFKIEGHLAKTIIIKGLPLVTNEIFWAAGLSTLFKFYSTRGNDFMVGYGIANTVSDLFYVLFSGMSVATTIIISQSLGANHLEEAKKNAYHLIEFSILLAVICGMLMFATSFVVPKWYDVTPEARELAATFLRVTSVMISIYMTSAQCYFILRSGGDTIAAFMLDSCYMWAVNITVVGCLAYLTNFNILILYLAGQSTDLLKMAIAFFLVRRGKWIRNLTKRKELINEN